MTGKLCCRNERTEEQSLFWRCPSLLSLTLMSALLSPLSLQAADVRRSGDEAFIIQQQRQEALEQQLTPSAPDVRLSAPGSFAHKINFPVETPCFQIKQTELKGADALPHWLPLQKIANGAVGHCLGAKGINLLMSTLQNRLVDHGYVTTRVLAPSQDLKSGILRLVIIPGVVRHVRLTPDSDDYIQLYSSFPAHEGSLLDLRDIEQGLDLGNSRIQGQHTELNATSGNLSTQNAQLSAGTLSARTAGQFSSNGGTINADTLQISAQSLSNRKGSLIQTGTGDFSLSLPGSVDNREGLLAANGAVRLDALSLDNRKGKVQAEQSPSLQKSPPTFLKPFVAGVCAALLAVSVAIPGWQFLTQPSPAEQQLRALLTPPPDVLSAGQMTQLSRTPSLLNHASEWITLSGQQITRLAELPPAYNLQRSAQLLQQLRVLFPDNPRVQEMVDNWQKSVRSRALPEEAMAGWNEGMTRLQQLAERLNRLDEQRGKYMTVSELKTEVFGIMQAFNRHIPAEEQLRRYDEVRNQNSSEQQQKKVENGLVELVSRYWVLTQGDMK